MSADRPRGAASFGAAVLSAGFRVAWSANAGPATYGAIGGCSPQRFRAEAVMLKVRVRVWTWAHASDAFTLGGLRALLCFMNLPLLGG